SLFKKKDVIIILILLFISAILLLIFNQNSNKKVYAEIYLDGNLQKKICLNYSKDGIIKLNENVSFEVKNKKIRFIDTNCPDKLCEKVSYISKINQVSVCMPNKVLLKITGNDDNIDIIVN
ncbi:MAG: NusG domain II-containing protein, partial [Oscillospiraceae bacterium]